MTAPNFFIVGAPKCGTTALAAALSVHPDIFMSDPKEIHFFNHDIEASDAVEKYLADYFSGSDGASARGEASPSYLYAPGTPERLRRAFPNTRLRIIVMVRDPIRRFISHYQHYVRSHPDAPSIGVVLDTLISGQPAPDVPDLLTPGLYGSHLVRWGRVFREEDMLVIEQARLLGGWTEQVDRVLRFLEVPERSLPNIETNKAGEPRLKAISRIMSTPANWKNVLKATVPKSARQRLRHRIGLWNNKPFTAADAPITLDEPRVEALRSFYRADQELLNSLPIYRAATV